MRFLRTPGIPQVIFFIGAVIVIAFLIPALISTNLHSFLGEERMFAEYALQEASHGWNPVESILARKYRVLWVRELKLSDEGVYQEKDLRNCNQQYIGGQANPTVFEKPYQARIQEIGFFGIPMSQFQILCTGAAWRISYE